MNKNDIKTKWGQYTDTDKLVDDMMALLTKYGHRCTEHGVCCVLEKFFTNKEPLIKLLQKSDNYAGDLRIVLDEQIERYANHAEIRSWMKYFPDRVSANKYIRKQTDANGKTMADYLKIGKTKVSIKDLEDKDLQTAVSKRKEKLDEFTYDGFTRTSIEEYERFLVVAKYFRDITSSTLDDEQSEYLKSYDIHKGTKTSRAFNKICNKFGVDKSPNYNKEFARYADMVSGLKRDIKFFISVNPLDYLTMSFGVNWSSCHTIDKHNIRNISYSSGGYCGGTMSYMLDTTSIITYVHDTMPENCETGKVYRNMFHLGDDGLLLQNRIYPQGNDGCTDLYKAFRSIVHKELTPILRLENNKWIKSNSSISVTSFGVHYKDYNYNDSCNISYPTERPQCKNQSMTVGSTGVCPYCGRSTQGLSSSYLGHHDCTDPTQQNEEV